MEVKSYNNKILVPREELTIFEERYLNYIELLDLFLASPEKVVYVEEQEGKKLKGIIKLESLSSNYNASDQWMNQDYKFVIQTDSSIWEEAITEALPIPVLDEDGTLRYELKNRVILFETVEEKKKKLIREINQLIDKIDFRNCKNIAVYGYEKEIANFLLEKLTKKGCNTQIMEREEIVLDGSIDLFLCVKDSEAKLFRGMFYSENNAFKVSTEIKSVWELV